MTSRTHDLIAFGGLLTAAVLFPPVSINVSTLMLCLIGNTVGALIPDMDQATNNLWDMLPGGNFTGSFFRKIMLSHRTVSHSILGVFIEYNLFWFILPKILNPKYIDINLVIISMMIGIILHIAADALTKEGVPLLFPIGFKFGFPPFAFLRITTGKFVEKALVFPSVLVYILWLVFIKKEAFLHILKLIKT
jgi:inner membrane protein